MRNRNPNYFYPKIFKKKILINFKNNRFRSGIKEMEVMIINVINAVFDTVTYVEQGVEILDAFMHLSAREVNYFLA